MPNLGLAVIDEQHRFGVHQRLMLGDKGKATDILVMTATPIPRTLVMTAYGDMDVSKLDEKPAGRSADSKPVLLHWSALINLIERIASALDKGQKIFWICPLVEENDELGSDLRHRAPPNAQSSQTQHPLALCMGA